MFCPNCGKELKEGARFCRFCGAQVQAAPEPPAPEPEPKKRRVPLGFIVVIVVALLLAAGALLLSCGSDSVEYSNEAEEGTTSTEVTYYNDEDESLAVASSATIVFCGSDGEELEEFDLYFMDGAGKVSYFLVNDATGPFSPGGWGVEPGTYRMIIRERDTNIFHTVPKIVVVDDDADGGDYDNFYDDEVRVVPDDSGTDTDTDTDTDTGDATAKQAAYALYYARVLELQESEGEGAEAEDGELASGLGVVLLVDIAQDGDGIEELVLAYGMDSDEHEGTVEVWRYDAEANDIELVCEEPYGGTDDAVMISVIEYGTSSTEDFTLLNWNYWYEEDGSTVFGYYAVSEQEGSVECHEAKAVVGSSGSATYYIDGEATDVDSYDEDCWTYGIYSDEHYDQYTQYTTWVYSTTEWTTYEGDGYACYAPADTLVITEETIETLRFGMMGITEDELWGTDGDTDGTVDGEAIYEDYAAVLDAYESEYGTVAQQGVSDGYPYLTGLCFAELVDFDDDGVDELVLAYSTDSTDPFSNYDGDNYVIEVWGATEAGDGAELLFEGTEWMQGNGDPTAAVAIVCVDNTYYLAQGSISDDSSLYLYGDTGDGFGLVRSFVYDGGSDITTTDDDVCKVDGDEVDSSTYSAESSEYYEALITYWLMYPGGDSSTCDDALSLLSETLAQFS